MKWSSDVAPPLAGGKKGFGRCLAAGFAVVFVFFIFFSVEGEAVVDCSYFIRFLFLFL